MGRGGEPLSGSQLLPPLPRSSDIYPQCKAYAQPHPERGCHAGITYVLPAPSAGAPTSGCWLPKSTLHTLMVQVPGVSITDSLSHTCVMLYTVLGTGDTVEAQVTYSAPNFLQNCLQGAKAVPNKFLIWSLVHILSEQCYTW